MSDNKYPKAPDGEWGWMVVLGCTVVNFLVAGLGRSFGVLLIPIRDNYQTTAAGAAWTQSLYTSVMMFGAPVASMLSERFTCRLVVFTGGMMAAAGFILAALAPSLIIVYLTCGLIAGIGGSLVLTPSFIIVGKYFDKKKGKAMSFSTIGAGLGNVTLAPMISECLAEYGYFGTVLILGALMLNVCVAAPLYRPLEMIKDAEANIEKEIESTTKTTTNALNSSESGSDCRIHLDEKNRSNISQNNSRHVANLLNNCNLTVICDQLTIFGRKHFAVLCNPRFLLYLCQIATLGSCAQSVLSSLPDLGILHGFSKNLSAVLLSIVGGSDMLGRFLFGFIFDLKIFYNRRRMLHSILGISFATISLLFGLCKTYIHFVITCVVWALLEGGYHSQRATVISEFTSKDSTASAIAFTIAATGIGNLMGPAVGGWLKDLSGDYVYTFIFSGAPHLIMTSLFLVDYFYSQGSIIKREKPLDV